MNLIQANQALGGEIMEQTPAPRMTGTTVEPLQESAVLPRTKWGWISVLLVLAVAAGLRLWNLDQNGHGNTYYAAAVRSMMSSPRLFFFASFDPGGFVSVDKPPVGLWIQTLSALAFGYGGYALLLPQALMGIGAVAVLIAIVHRTYGTLAAALAGLTLAISPINVAVDRENLLDTCLVLVTLIAALVLLRATERGQLRTLLLAMLLVGIGFNVKMLAAFVVLPAFVAVYFVGAPIGWGRRLLHLMSGGAVLAAVSLSWMLVVDLTPADRRPYVGGSRNNTVWNLVAGYNGLDRIVGGGPGVGPPGGPFGGRPGPRGPIGGPGAQAAAVFAPPGFGPGGSGGPPGFGGKPGWGRLFQLEMVGQAMWLFPGALLGAVIGLAMLPSWSRREPGLQGILLWSGWLALHFVVFSLSRGIMHTYYLVMLTPAIAALFGIGVAATWKWVCRNRWAGLPAVLCVGLNAGWQIYVAREFDDWTQWLTVTIGVGAGVSILGLVVALCLARRRVWFTNFGIASLTVGLVALAVAPTGWSLTPVLAKGNGMMPMADPSLLSSDGLPFGPPQMPRADTQALLKYLRANRNGERFLVATPSAMQAAPLIIESGEPVMAIGGFMGGDPILTSDGFARLVADGQVRFALSAPFPMPGMGRPSGGDLMGWIRETGQPVGRSLWSADEDADAVAPSAEEPDDQRRRPGMFDALFSRFRPGPMLTLYELSPRRETAPERG